MKQDAEYQALLQLQAIKLVGEILARKLLWEMLRDDG